MLWFADIEHVLAHGQGQDTQRNPEGDQDHGQGQRNIQGETAS